MSKSKSEVVGADVLTGKEVLRESDEHDECPQCKKRSFAGHHYHQSGKCLTCGFFHPWDD